MQAQFTEANRTKDDVYLIVLHCTDGEGGSESVLRYWANAGIEASYHYIINRDGSLATLVDPKNIAWHAGNREINRRSIGISYVGKAAGFVATDAQAETAEKLLAKLSYDFELSLRRIVTYEEGRSPQAFGVLQHANVPGSDHTDISSGFPIRDVCAGARAYRNNCLGKIPVELR